MSTDLATFDQRPYAHPRPLSDVVDVVAHLDKLWDLASMLVKSRMLPASIATPEAAVAIMLKGRELGLGAMAAFSGITVIQGKPVVSPQLMLSLINRSGVLEDMAVEDDGQCCRVTMKRRGRSPHTASFSMDDARAMQLAGKDNWKKMPAVMRQWRAVAACARVACPDVIDGMYTPEELGAEVNEDGEIVQEIDVEPAPEPERPRENALAAGRSAKGLFTKASQAKTEEFNAWMTEQCRKINARYHDEWNLRTSRALEDGHAIPEKITDVINPWQAKGHLLKWAIEVGLIPASSVPEDPKTRQDAAYVASIFEENKDAIRAEMGAYLQQQRRKHEMAIFRKHPELAPDGYFEELEEAARSHGDAYEGDLASDQSA